MKYFEIVKESGVYSIYKLEENKFIYSTHDQERANEIAYLFEEIFEDGIALGTKQALKLASHLMGR